MNLELNESSIIAYHGWRQGSIFDPRDIDLDVVSVAGHSLDENELLIICTQSCSVVERDFSKEPLFECLAITMLEKYNPKSPAATGKVIRKLQIGIHKHPNYKGIECNLNKRFFIDRRKLTQTRPKVEFQIDVQEVIKLAGWISRYYNRIAQPDELVNRMRLNLLNVLKKCINKNHPFNNSPFSESISTIYIDWQPREFNGEFFLLRLFFICSDSYTEQYLDELLLLELADFLAPQGKDDIKIINLRCGNPDNIFIGEVTGYERYTEWDDLSELGEFINAPLLKKAADLSSALHEL